MLWLIWRGVEVRAREKWLVDEATDKANAAFLELMMEEETEVRHATPPSHRLAFPDVTLLAASAICHKFFGGGGCFKASLAPGEQTHMPC